MTFLHTRVREGEGEDAKGDSDMMGSHDIRASALFMRRLGIALSILGVLVAFPAVAVVREKPADPGSILMALLLAFCAVGTIFGLFGAMGVLITDDAVKFYYALGSFQTGRTVARAQIASVQERTRRQQRYIELADRSGRTLMSISTSMFASEQRQALLRLLTTTVD